MSRWRVLVVAFLLSGPILIWAGIGTWYLWQSGLAFWTWWPLMGLVVLGYLLGWYWQRKRQLLLPPDFETGPHWTERDRNAWKLVEARAARAAEVPMEKLSEPVFFLEMAREMANELAVFYHPGAKDPIDNVTVPELLAVAELASGDLWQLVEEHLPGGHLLTVGDWKRSRQLLQMYQAGSNLYWIISAIFNPMQTGLRYLGSRYGIGQPLQMLQQNLFAWFYVAFVHRLGRYLIDLNSGRLRVGAARYRELVQQLEHTLEKQVSVTDKVVAGPFPMDASGEVVSGDGSTPGEVTITIFGQVKAGKSSLVNALLGEQRARTGVVPTTVGLERYELLTPGLPTKLILLDTVGYGQAGPRADQVKATAEAMRQSDLVFLVLHARNPARQADVEMLDQLRTWFAERPDVNMPVVIVILTHIDLLSPAMEWAPPYDWLTPKTPKEQNIHDAIATARQQLGEKVVAVVPVCTATDRVYGIDEALLPVVSQWVDEAHGVALLRCLKAEADRDWLKREWGRLKNLGAEAVRMAGEMLRASARTGS